MSKAKEILSNISNMSERSDQDIIRELVKAFGRGAEEEIKGSFDHKGRYGTWGKSGSFKADGEEYNWIEDEKEAERIALEIVKDDLESDPSIFNQEWLKGFIYVQGADTMAQEEADDLVDNVMSDEEILKEAGVEDEYEEEEDDDKKQEILDNAREELRNQFATKIERDMEDPIQYFVHDQGIYRIEDLMKADFIRINVEEAAQDAIDTDGVAHFISLYDGTMDTTPGGVVYFRE